MGYWLICTLSLSHPLRPPRCLPQPRQIRLDFPCLTEVHQIKGAVTNSIISSTCTRIEPPVAGVAITILYPSKETSVERDRVGEVRLQKPEVGIV